MSKNIADYAYDLAIVQFKSLLFYTQAWTLMLVTVSFAGLLLHHNIFVVPLLLSFISGCCFCRYSYLSCGLMRDYALHSAQPRYPSILWHGGIWLSLIALANIVTAFLITN